MIDDGIFWIFVVAFVLIVGGFSFVQRSNRKETRKKEQWLRNSAEEEERRRRMSLEREEEGKRNTARERRLQLAAELEPEIQEVRHQVEERAQDPALRVRLGHLLLSIGEVDDANTQYATALALGVSDHKTAGLVHLLYAYSLGSREHVIDTPEDRLEREKAYSYEAISTCQYTEVRSFIGSVTGAIWAADKFGGKIKIQHWRLEHQDLRRNHLEEAIRSFESSIRIDPRTDLDVLHILRDIYDEQENRGERKGRIEALIEEAKAPRYLSTPSPSRTTETTEDQGGAFEHRCYRLLTAMGYSATVTGQDGDGGVDIRAEDRSPIVGGRLLVQCKDWQSPIGEPALRDLYGLVQAERANKGIFIATSGFTLSAEQFASGKPLELIDRDMLLALEQQYVQAPETGD